MKCEIFDDDETYELLLMSEQEKKLPLKNLHTHAQWQQYQQQPHIRESVKEAERSERITWRIIFGLHVLFIVVLALPHTWAYELEINPIYLLCLVFCAAVIALYYAIVWLGSRARKSRRSFVKNQKPSNYGKH